MITVKNILKEKGSQVWSIKPEAKVIEALKSMARREIGALVVTDKRGVVGIFSERDYARKIALKGKTSLDTSVRDIMTPEVYFVNADTTAEECMALMTRQRVRHLPVIQKRKLIGIISIGDVVKSIISEKEITIEHLKDYISGKYI